MYYAWLEAATISIVTLATFWGAGMLLSFGTTTITQQIFMAVALYYMLHTLFTAVAGAFKEYRCESRLGRPGIAGQRPLVLSARVIFLLYWEIYVAKRSAKRREWTTQDVRELKKLAKHKTPTAKIARALKRTEGATRQKASNLDVSLDTRS
jgi:hypothetical protein